jgi:CBS domain containing-hemolysin-like protein
VTVRKTRIDQLIAEGHRARAPSGAASPSRRATLPRLSFRITMASLALGWISEPALATLVQPGIHIPCRP